MTPVTDREVLEENYGGEVMNGMVPPMQRNQVRAMKRFTNAYMLVYIRESAIDEVLAPWKDEDTPAHLSTYTFNERNGNSLSHDPVERRLEEERLQMEAKKREREEQHLYLTAKVITDQTFSEHEGFDLATFDERNWPATELPSFRVLKNEPYSTFKSRVAQHFNYPENQIRLWVLVNRQNKTVRPDTHIPENEPQLSEFMSYRAQYRCSSCTQPSKRSGTLWPYDNRMTSACTWISSLTPVTYVSRCVGCCKPLIVRLSLA